MMATELVASLASNPYFRWLSCSHSKPRICLCLSLALFHYQNLLQCRFWSVWGGNLGNCRCSFLQLALEFANIIIIIIIMVSPWSFPIMSRSSAGSCGLRSFEASLGHHSWGLFVIIAIATITIYYLIILMMAKVPCNDKAYSWLLEWVSREAAKSSLHVSVRWNLNCGDDH